MTEPDTTEPPGTLAALQARYGPKHRWYLLLAVMVGTMASIMSSTIVNVAIPDLSHHFTLGQERAQWVSSGFMVAMTVSMLTTPWLLGKHRLNRLANVDRLNAIFHVNESSNRAVFQAFATAF